MKKIQMADYKPAHFGWSVCGKIATITLNRPERKNRRDPPDTAPLSARVRVGYGVAGFL